MSNPTTTLRVLFLLATPIGWFMAAGYQVARIIRDMRQRPYYDPCTCEWSDNRSHLWWDINCPEHRDKKTEEYA